MRRKTHYSRVARGKIRIKSRGRQKMKERGKSRNEGGKGGGGSRGSGADRGSPPCPKANYAETWRYMFSNALTRKIFYTITLL